MKKENNIYKGLREVKKKERNKNKKNDPNFIC